MNYRILLIAVPEDTEVIDMLPENAKILADTVSNEDCLKLHYIGEI